MIREAHRRGLLVIGDIKRSDIGSTAAAYARAHLLAEDGSAADFLTVSYDALACTAFVALALDLGLPSRAD